MTRSVCFAGMGLLSVCVWIMRGEGSSLLYIPAEAAAAVDYRQVRAMSGEGWSLMDNLLSFLHICEGIWQLWVFVCVVMCPFVTRLTLTSS